MSGKLWDEAQDAALRQVVAEYDRWPDRTERFTEMTGVQRTTISLERRWTEMGRLGVREIRAACPGGGGKESVLFPDKKVGVVDWRKAFDLSEAMIDQHREMSSSQDEATVEIKTDGPEAVAFSSDWHMAAVSTDHKMLRAHIEYVLKTPRLRIVSVSDEIHNMQMFRNVSARTQTLAPKDQHLILESILDELCSKRKLLASCAGTHPEEFEEKVLGWSPTALMKARKTVYFRGIGRLNLKVGKETYVVIMSHEGKGTSQWNPLHSSIKQAMMYCPDADVSVTAHTHNPCFSVYYGHRLAEKHQPTLTYPHKMRVDVKCGTFNINDPYSQRYFGQGRIGVPTIVFYPDRHEMIPFATPEMAMEFMGEKQ